LASAQGSTFEGRDCGLILKAHIPRDLAEDARSLDGGLRVYKYAAAAEDVLIQREGRGSKDAQEVWELERRVGICVRRYVPV
jgi:hypothetical protein